MARKPEIEYSSPLPIYKTIEFDKDIQIRFLEDKADFILYSTTKYSDPYGADLLLKIKAAEAVPPDTTELAVIQGLTNIVEQKHDVCRLKFQGLKNFVKDAWPGDEAKLNEFGESKYEQARNEHWFMVPFMKNAFDRATQYQTELTTVGFAPAKTAELETVRNELDAANQEQNTAIGNRKTKTKLRRELNNAAYDAVRDLCDDGKIIYATDYAKYQRYLIPGLDTGSVVSGPVAKNTTENIWRRTMQPTDQLKIESLTGGLLKFCLSPDDETACDLVGVEVPAVSEMTITVSELGDTANRYFNVTNKDLDNDGEYKVTVL